MYYLFPLYLPRVRRLGYLYLVPGKRLLEVIMGVLGP